jgi:pilus assembly protein FimV
MAPADSAAALAPCAIESLPDAAALVPIATLSVPVAVLSAPVEFTWKYSMPWLLISLSAAPTLLTVVVVPLALYIV